MNKKSTNFIEKCAIILESADEYPYCIGVYNTFEEALNALNKQLLEDYGDSLEDETRFNMIDEDNGVFHKTMNDGWVYNIVFI